MNKLMIGAMALSLVGASAASAQPNDRDHGGDHGGGDHGGGHPGWGQDQGNGHRWQRGQRMGYNDWQSAQPIDYRQHHLHAPPRGYEWRQSNGQYVLAAVATGVIASIILSNGH